VINSIPGAPKERIQSCSETLTRTLEEQVTKVNLACQKTKLRTRDEENSCVNLDLATRREIFQDFVFWDRFNPHMDAVISTDFPSQGNHEELSSFKCLDRQIRSP
jgi:hypothetical protein